MDRYSPEKWEIIKRALGPERAAAWLASGQVEVGPVVTGGLPSATMPGGAQQGNMSMDMNGTQQPTGGLALAAGQPPAQQPPQQPPQMDTLASLGPLLMAAQARSAATHDEILRAGQEHIKQAYGGPSRLWALSQALLAPRPYRGFAGTAYNISSALGANAEQRRAAEERRKDAEFNLQQTTAATQTGDEMAAFKLRYEIARDREENAAKLAEAGRKANEPNWVAVPQGGSLQDTNQLGLPTLTPEQVVELRKNPANYGKKFRTVDGRPMEL